MRNVFLLLAGFMMLSAYDDVCAESTCLQNRPPLAERAYLELPTEGFYQLTDMYNSDTCLKPFLDCGEKLVIRQIDLHSTYRCAQEGADDSPWKYDLDGDGELASLESPPFQLP